MSQKYIKSQNKNSHNVKSYGKYYATAVYDNHFIGTEELADFIQQQASVKKSDIKAVLDELGAAMKHYFELGQKVKLDGIGILKVGFSSIGVNKKDDCTAATITTRRVLFQPETERVVVGQVKNKEGKIVQKYVNAITLLKDVVFEETHNNAMNVEPEEDNGSAENGGGSSTGSDTGNGGQSGNGGSQSGNGSEQGGNSGSQSGNGNQSQGGNEGGNSQATTYALTITKSGTGTASVKNDSEETINSGDSLASGANVYIAVTPATGQIPTATLNGESVSLSENDGEYVGTFQMPAQASSLVINSGSVSGGSADQN
jgi:predicted histone-like DNA-binding protein